MIKCVREAYGAPRCVDWCREPRDCIARPAVCELLFDEPPAARQPSTTKEMQK